MQETFFVRRTPKVSLDGIVLRAENQLSARKTTQTRLTFAIKRIFVDFCFSYSTMVR